MRTSEKGINLIIGFEGFCGKATKAVSTENVVYWFDDVSLKLATE